MNKINYLQSSAIFMALLVISMPIYISSVYAQDSSANFDVYVLNSEETEGYRARNDRSIVVAEINAPGVSVEDVRLVTSNNAAFQSCSPQDGKTICKYEFSQGSWPLGSYTFVVRYGSTKSATVIVDDYAPNVTITGIDNGKELSVSYNIRERISEGSSQCSGIKRLSFVLGGVVVNTTILPSSTGCSITGGTSKMSVPSTNNIEKFFCVEAYDGAGNKGSSCEKIIIDREPSSASNPYLAKANGDRIDFITASVGPILNAQARFTLNEQNLFSLKADASEFSYYDLQKQEMLDVAGSCNPVNCNGTCVCKVPVTLNLPYGGNPVLRVTTRDYSGNEANLTIPYSVQADNDAPTVRTFSAKQCGDRNALGLSNNTVNVVVVDSGSGMDDEAIWLDLTPVLDITGGSRINARSCTNIGNEWGCSFGVFPVTTGPVHGSTIRLSLSPGSQDDAGNSVSHEPASFFFDSQSPKYISHSIRGIKNVAFQEEIEAYPSSGGTIELKIVATDDLTVSAIADFSNVAYMGTKGVSCEGETNKTCTFTEIGPLIAGPKFNLKIPVRLIDCVGNTYQINLSMNISDIKDKPGSYGSYVISYSTPEKIDKLSLNEISHSMFFSLEWVASSTTTPISQKVTECSGSTDYLEIIDGDERLPVLLSAPSKYPTAQFKFQRGIQDPGDSLTYTCTIRTISRSTAGIITPPEYDNVTFDVPFYNDPLGSIDDAAQKKLDAVKTSSLVSGKGAKLITKLQSLFDTLSSMCRLWQSLLEMATIIDSVALIICTIKAPNPATAAACKGASTTGEATSDLTEVGLGEIFTNMCAFISCDYVPFLDTKVDWMRDLIYAWQNNPTSLIGLDFDISKHLDDNVIGKDKDKKIDAKDSLIFSVATLCVPGVIYNLNKARQIECMYVYCMEKIVPSGTPPYYCDAQRATMWCKYVWHEVFQLIPFVHAIDKLLKNLAQALASPLGIVSLALAGCNRLNEDTLKASCRIVRHGLSIASVITKYTKGDTWSSLLDFDSQKTTDYCAEVGIK
ncbi:hypothetical protein JXB27_03115 [Candidatus Woesearchaeota archaeon]|nr:hypothetical protein [Candidatus Woesearchaeota archaeon]